MTSLVGCALGGVLIRGDQAGLAFVLVVPLIVLPALAVAAPKSWRTSDPTQTEAAARRWSRIPVLGRALLVGWWWNDRFVGLKHPLPERRRHA